MIHIMDNTFVKGMTFGQGTFSLVLLPWPFFAKEFRLTPDNCQAKVKSKSSQVQREREREKDLDFPDSMVNPPPPYKLMCPPYKLMCHPP